MMCVRLMVALLTHSVLVLGDGGSLPLWKTQLVHYPKWEGYFVYQNRRHECNMTVHSVEQGSDNGAFVAFSADRTKIDMNALSDNDISIVFKAEAIYEPGDHFYTGFRFAVELLDMGVYHVLLGNITHPASNASTIRLRPQGNFTTHSNVMRSSALSIGLAVGISLSLAVVCVVAGILFLRWAIRKGYLRHVAMSYKSFRNPRDDTPPPAEPPVTFTSAQTDSRPEEVNVHI